VLARLREGVTLEQAEAELIRIAADLAREYPKTNRTWAVTVRPLTETVVSDVFRRALLVVGVAVGLVLLIACANVAGLLLSRSTMRAREMAVRIAVGASRSVLVKQMLTESAVLAGAGGACGVLLAIWGLDAVSALAAENVPRADEIAMRPAVLLFAVGATAASALVAGVVPAMATSRSRLAALREREPDGGRGTSRTRDVIVVGQIAVAIVLLVGAGLMMRSFRQLQHRDLGFTSENLLLVDVTPRTDAPLVPFYEQLAERVASLPGVETVALGSSLPFAGPNSGNVVAIEGRTFAPGEAPDADYRAVTASYFRALGIPIVRGRTFSSADANTPVVLVNQTAARRFFPDGEVIGRRIRLGGAPWATVVGVVADARYFGLDDPSDEARPMVYVSHLAMAPLPMTIAARTAVPPSTLIAAIRSAIASSAPNQPIVRVESMDAILADVRGPQRFNTTLLAIFAWIALVLAAAGIWALMAHMVARRTHEIGLRVALGATPRDILRMTAGHGLTLAALGLVFGLLAAAGLTRVLQRALFEVSPTDPITLAGVSIVLLAVATSATLIPVRRALRIDPAEALRLE
jgi:putative ABC transport system permease protein